MSTVAACYRIREFVCLKICFALLCSGAMVAFFLYKITVNGKQQEGSDMEQEAEN